MCAPSIPPVEADRKALQAQATKGGPIVNTALARLAYLDKTAATTAARDKATGFLPLLPAPPPSRSATTVARADGLSTISRGTDQYRIPLINR